MQDLYGPTAAVFFKWLMIVAVAGFGIGAIGVSITSYRSKHDDRDHDNQVSIIDANEWSDEPLSSGSGGLPSEPTQLSEGRTGQRIYADENGITLPKFLAVAVALSTIVSGVFAAFQWQAMRQQNTEMLLQREISAKSLEHSRKTLAVMQGELRAWLEFGQPTMSEPEEADWIDVDIPITNYGKTAATISAWGGDAIHISSETYYDLEKCFYDDDGNESPMHGLHRTIPPGKLITLRVRVDDPGEDFIERVRNGTEDLAVYGWISYGDVFEEYGPRRWALHFDDESQRFVEDGWLHHIP